MMDGKEYIIKRLKEMRNKCKLEIKAKEERMGVLQDFVKFSYEKLESLEKCISTLKEESSAEPYITTFPKVDVVRIKIKDTQ
jgi:uncharacterized protein YkuJ